MEGDPGLQGIWVKLLIPGSTTIQNEKMIHSSFYTALRAKGIQFHYSSLGIVPGCSFSVRPDVDSVDASKYASCIQADIHMNLPCKSVVDIGKNIVPIVRDCLKLALCDLILLPEDQPTTGLLVQMTYYCSSDGPGFREYYFNDVKGSWSGTEDGIDNIEDKLSSLQEQLNNLKSRL